MTLKKWSIPASASGSGMHPLTYLDRGSS